VVEPYKPWAWLEIASCNCFGLAGYTGSGNTVDFDIAVVACFGMGHFAAAAAAAAAAVEH